MNKTIYLQTIRKILRHKFIVFMLFAMGFLVPVSTILSPEPPAITTVEGWDSFAVSAVVGLITVTASNVIGNAITIGGRSDYMPLIVTRPLHRYQYVISKWLALSTVIIAVSLIQHVLLAASGTFSRWGMTGEMIVIGAIERIISALCVSSVLTMIYVLPNQTMVLCGIIAFEVAIGISLFSLSLSAPMPETTTNVAATVASILGVETWLKTTLLPSIFGGNALNSIHQYVDVMVNLSSFLAPQIHLYDILETRPFRWAPLMEPFSNMLLALTVATTVLNAREYHYDTD